MTASADSVVTQPVRLPADDDANAQLPRTYGHIARRLAPVLILMYVIAFLDRVNISFAALTMNRDLGLSDATFGLGAGIFFIGYLLFAIPSNLAMARLGARRWIAAILVVWGLVSAGMALVNGAPAYLVLRFLLGAAESGFFPGIILYLTLWLPSQARAGVTALFVVSIPLANVIGAPLSNRILMLAPGHGWHPWQWLFVLEALPAILVGLIVPLLLPNGPEQASWLSAPEKIQLAQALAADQRASTQLQPAAPLLTRATGIFSIGYFALMLGLYAIGFWVPKLLVTLGTPAHLLGWLTALPSAAGILFMLLWSRHSDRTRERRGHLVLAYGIAGLGLALTGTAHSATSALVGLSLAAIGIFSAMPVFWAACTQQMSKAVAPAAIALINSVGNLGGFLGPVAMGRLLTRTHSHHLGFQLMGGCLLIGGMVLLAGLPARAPSVASA